MADRTATITIQRGADRGITDWLTATRIVVASVAHAVAVRILLVGIRIERAVVFAVIDAITITIVIGVARVTLAVRVGVSLVVVWAR